MCALKKEKKINQIKQVTQKTVIVKHFWNRNKEIRIEINNPA